MDKLPSILFDAERMKYPHTGLYHYCLEAGKALLQSPQSNNLSIHFYLPSQERGVFGEKASYLTQSPFHKFCLLNTNKYDLWHCTYQGSRYFPFKAKCKKIITVHDINFMYDTNKSASKKQQYLDDLRRKIDVVDQIIVISNFVKDQLAQYIPQHDKPISVIYNGCNINPTISVIKPSVIPQSPFLFTIGTITDKKNFHVLPRLLSDTTLQLVIAGIEQSRGYKEVIITEAIKYGVLDRVHFVGTISESNKLWYYQHCKAFVFPSLAEGFGLPVIEAMHFGKPVFLSKATSLPEIGGTDAYYFTSFEQLTMKTILTNGLKDYEVNNRKLSIMQRAQSFQWKHVAEAHCKIYMQLLGHG
ncbi:MAG: glycosyltransferase family 4 protein [Chitinophagaceae bacterium]|nr:glycosyltransferase family 4 protein [Chitinophagaceae bacterium]